MRKPSPAAISAALCLAASAAQADLGVVQWQPDAAATHSGLATARLNLLPGNAAPKSGIRVKDWAQALKADPWLAQVSGSVYSERGLTPAKQPTLKYRWQLQYRLAAPLQVGLQGSGELGSWHDWLPGNTQAQRLGPAVSGTWLGAQGQPRLVQAACLADLASGRACNTITMRLHGAF